MRYPFRRKHWFGHRLALGKPCAWAPALLFVMCILAASCLPVPTPVIPDTSAPLTAREAWELAAPELLDWQPNLTLVYARPLAQPVAGTVADPQWRGRYSGWSFQVCAEGAKRCQSVVVDASASPLELAIAEGEFRGSVDPLALAAWRVDSDQALAVAMAHGLQEWLNGVAEQDIGPTPTLGIKLVAQNRTQGYWRILVAIGEEALEARISADDGRVLSWVELSDCAICGF